jgi:uncharacterized membrane protein YkoI
MGGEDGCRLYLFSLSLDWLNFERVSISHMEYERSKTMKNLIITLAGTIALAAFIATGVTAHAFNGQEYAKDAKISLAAARKIALKVFPGSIVSEELEREKGGSGLCYSFDIRRHGVTHEVGVDAVTGKVLENSVEGPYPD